MPVNSLVRSVDHLDDYCSTTFEFGALVKYEDFSCFERSLFSTLFRVLESLTRSLRGDQ